MEEIGIKGEKGKRGSGKGRVRGREGKRVRGREGRVKPFGGLSFQAAAL